MKKTLLKKLSNAAKKARDRVSKMSGEERSNLSEYADRLSNPMRKAREQMNKMSKEQRQEYLKEAYKMIYNELTFNSPIFRLSYKKNISDEKDIWIDLYGSSIKYLTFLSGDRKKDIEESAATFELAAEWIRENGAKYLNENH